MFTDFEDLQLDFENPPTLGNHCAEPTPHAIDTPCDYRRHHLASVQRRTPERHPRNCLASTTGAALLRNSRTEVALLFLLSSTIALCQATPVEPVAQESEPAQTRNHTQTQNQTQAPAQTQSSTTTPARPQLPETPSSPVIDPNEKILHQPPRIMGVLPNFTAVDSNTRLPRLTTREKFIVAMHDSVDYSSFLLVAGLAGKGLYSNTIPSLGRGTAGFGRYYWREFTDQVSGTFFTEAIFPTLTHEDPRYYTLVKNGFFTRAGYT